jgi:hypothetical protein
MFHSEKKRFILLLFLSLTFSTGGGQVLAFELEPEDGPADAAETLKVTDARQWEYAATLIVWLPSIDADTGIGPIDTEVDISVWDILDEADDVFSFSGRFDARRDKLNLFLEGAVVNVEASATIPVLAGVDAELETRIGFLEFGADYRLLDKPFNDGTDQRLLFDATGGLRYIHFKLESKAVGLGPGGIKASLGGTEEWFEVMVGGKFSWVMTRRT